MALLACHINVRARQGEVAFIMIESNLIPSRCRVTRRTIRPELSIVTVVLFMA